MIGRIVALVLLVTVIGLSAACAASPGPTPSASPSAAAGVTGLLFAYGVGAENVLDTAHGTFTKDMIAASPITVAMTLDEEELARIAAGLVAIDIWSYPSVYTTAVTAEGGWMEPHPTYRFEVTTARGTKVVEWEDAVWNSDPRAAKLRGLARLILRIVEARPEYQKLPPPTGGYL